MGRGLQGLNLLPLSTKSTKAFRSTWLDGVGMGAEGNKGGGEVLKLSAVKHPKMRSESSLHLCCIVACAKEKNVGRQGTQ